MYCGCPPVFWMKDLLFWLFMMKQDGLFWRLTTYWGGLGVWKNDVSHEKRPDETLVNDLLFMNY